MRTWARATRSPGIWSAIRAQAVHRRGVWLDRAPDWDGSSARVDRISRLMPSLSRGSWTSPIPLIFSRWMYDPQFHLSWHVRRIGVPSPDLGRGAPARALAAMDTFDRARPLWELTWSRASRTDGGRHRQGPPSLSDGVGGCACWRHRRPEAQAPRAGEIRRPAGRERRNSSPWSPTPRADSRAAHAPGPARGRGSHPDPDPRRTRPGRPRPRRRRDGPLGLPDSRAEFRRHVTPDAGAGDDTPSRLMEVSLDALKAAAKAADGTVNDAYLAVVTGGLRRYHERHGTSAESCGPSSRSTSGPRKTRTGATRSPCSG